MALSGSALRGMPNDIYGQLTTIAWESGIPTILDTSGERLLRGIEAAPAVIKPNQKEIGQLMGKEEALADDLIDHCMAYVGAGVQCVVVSLGSEGALLITKEGSGKAGRRSLRSSTPSAPVTRWSRRSPSVCGTVTNRK